MKRLKISSPFQPAPVQSYLALDPLLRNLLPQLSYFFLWLPPRGQLIERVSREGWTRLNLSILSERGKKCVSIRNKIYD